MALLYSTNFDAVTAGQLPSGWLDLNTAGYAAEAFNPISGANGFGMGTLTDGKLAIYSALAANTDFDVIFSSKVVAGNGTSGEQSYSCIVQANIGGTTFYLFGIQLHAGALAMYKCVSGAFTDIGGGQQPVTAFATNDIVTFRFQRTGTTLRYKAWLKSGSEPGTWQFSITDSSISAAGYAGLRSGTATDGSNVGPIVTIDDFSISDFTTPSRVSIALTDPNILKSPYNWLLTGGVLRTNCSGSELRFGFTGTSLEINFADTVAGNRVKYSVDNGPYVIYTMLATGSQIAITGLASGTHQFSIFASYIQQTGDYWATVANVVALTTILIDNGASSQPASGLSDYMLVAGDSITADITGTAFDSTRGFAQLIAKGFACEAGVRGFGGIGQAYNNGANSLVGYVVPHFTVGSDADSNWNKFDAAHSLLVSGLFAPAPKYIFLCYGANDKFWNDSHAGEGTDAQVQASLAACLLAYRTAAPSAKIFVLIPFGGFKRSALNAGVTQYKTATPDASTYVVDIGTQAGLTNNGASSQSADGVHPTSLSHAQLAAQIVKTTQALLGGGGGGINGSGILGMI